MMLICATGPKIFFEGTQHSCLHAEEPAAPVMCVYGASYFIHVLEGSEYFKVLNTTLCMFCDDMLSSTVMLPWSSNIQTLGLTLM